MRPESSLEEVPRRVSGSCVANGALHSATLLGRPSAAAGDPNWVPSNILFERPIHVCVRISTIQIHMCRQKRKVCPSTRVWAHVKGVSLTVVDLMYISLCTRVRPWGVLRSLAWKAFLVWLQGDPLRCEAMFAVTNNIDSGERHCAMLWRDPPLLRS